MRNKILVNKSDYTPDESLIWHYTETSKLKKIRKDRVIRKFAIEELSGFRPVVFLSKNNNYEFSANPRTCPLEGWTTRGGKLAWSMPCRIGIKFSNEMGNWKEYAAINSGNNNHASLRKIGRRNGSEYWHHSYKNIPSSKWIIIQILYPGKGWTTIKTY